MKKAAILVLFVTIISKMMGFVRDITLSYFYGISNISDAYIISLTIPDVIFSFIGVSIIAGYIPLFSEVDKSLGKEGGLLFTNNLLNILAVFCTIVISIALFFTESIVNIFASGFTEETFNLAVTFTKLGLVGLYFTVFCSIFQGYLQVNGNYVIPASIGIPLNIVVITAIIVSYYTDSIFLAIGTVMAALCQFLLLIVYAYKKGYRYRPYINFKDMYFKKVIIMVLPMTLGLSVNQINILIDRTLASSITEGGIAAINYANRLNLLVYGVFIMSIVTIIYPTISKMIVNNDMVNFKKLVSKSIVIISVMVIPAMTGLMILSEPVIQFLFGRGEFDQHAVEITGEILFFLSMGMFALGLNEILSRVFFSMQNTKTPMLNSIIGVLINIVLNITLSKYMGLSGLALATSISTTITMILYFVAINKKVGGLDYKYIFVNFAKLMIATASMAIITIYTHGKLITVYNIYITLIITIVISAIFYALMIMILNIADSKSHLSKIKSEFYRRRILRKKQSDK